MYRIVHDDCLNALRLMEDDSVDSVVTDPPYGIAFMNKKWDYDVPSTEIWREVYRVLKAGGHVLSFASPRTYHRMVVNIEDAGFEIRDMLTWMYGSGMPKGQDISKAIDKKKGATREVVGPNKWQHVMGEASKDSTTQVYGRGQTDKRWETAPATEEAVRWEGWNTQLKPSLEPIVLARKPLSEKTIAENVMKHGTGALNIDATRIPTTDVYVINTFDDGAEPFGNGAGHAYTTNAQPSQGRWPANTLLDGEAAVMLDNAVGDRKSGGKVRGTEPSTTGQNGIYGHYSRVENQPYSDSDGPSRFFYVSKASRKEREYGLDDLPSNGTKRKNNHNTVKPVDLMKWLITLVTPPNGVVLDPFVGSGTTCVAATKLGFRSIGIEREEDHVMIAEHRAARALQDLLKGVT